MTECERILAEGCIKKDFFREEVRCDFLVTTERKKVWAVGLDLLLMFDNFCKKHGLRYFVMFGTLLGGVRHKGFIPWDDDIDVVMPRDDYERLLKMGDKFAHPYFLQTPDTDPYYCQSHAKIRNTMTTAFNKITGYEGFNQGMFMDIFQLDHFVKEGARERFDQVKRLCIDLGTNIRIHNPNLSEKDRLRVEEFKARAVNPYEEYLEIERIASQFNNVETEFVACAAMSAYDIERLVWPKTAFETTNTIEFEGFYFPAPSMQDEILRTTYGDYMTFPPIEKRGGHNLLVYKEDSFVYDMDKSYVEYIKKEV